MGPIFFACWERTFWDIERLFQYVGHLHLQSFSTANGGGLWPIDYLMSSLI